MAPSAFFGLFDCFVMAEEPFVENRLDLLLDRLFLNLPLYCFILAKQSLTLDILIDSGLLHPFSSSRKSYPDGNSLLLQRSEIFLSSSRSCSCNQVSLSTPEPHKRHSKGCEFILYLPVRTAELSLSQESNWFIDSSPTERFESASTDLGLPRSANSVRLDLLVLTSLKVLFGLL